MRRSGRSLTSGLDVLLYSLKNNSIFEDTTIKAGIQQAIYSICGGLYYRLTHDIK
jgi:hypothetical protein